MQAYAAFRASLPTEMALAVERFQSHQWNLIDLIGCKRETLDLAKSNPALAYLFANNDELRKLTATSPAVQAQWHAHKRQREIAAWLGFPGTEATVKLMKKIVPESVSPTEGRLLQQALARDPGIARMVAHLKRINAGVLRLVSNGKLFPLVTGQLLVEVAENDDEVYYPRTADLLLDVRYLFERLHPHAILKPFGSARRIQEHHAQLVAELPLEEAFEKELRNRRKKLKAYPEPPIAGSEHIVPLTSQYQLRVEGRVQHNCVGGYLQRVRTRRLYIYKVLRPERATLSIIRDRKGKWNIGQLLLSHNRPASAWTVRAVHEWLTDKRHAE